MDTTDITVLFTNEGEKRTESVEMLKNSIPNSHIDIDLTDLKMHEVKDQREPLKRRMANNMQIILKIILDRGGSLIRSASLLIPQIAELQKTAEKRIEDIPECDIYRIVVLMNSHRELVEKRDHAKMIEILSVVAGDKIDAVIPIISSWIEDKSVMPDKILDQLYMAISNVDKLCMKYVKRTLF